MVLIALLVAIVLVVALVLVWGIGTSNRLVRQRSSVRASAAQVDVQLKRRHDLIPALVETIGGYAPQEQGALEAVTRARAAAVDAQEAAPARRAEAEGELSRVLTRLMVVAEAYPDLRDSPDFRLLQTELAATEQKIAHARQFLNHAVQTLNTSIGSAPGSLVAALGRFRREEHFAVGGDERREVSPRSR